MTTQRLLFMIVMCGAFCGACSSGSGLLLPPDQSMLVAVHSGSQTGVVYAPPGSADPGTIARSVEGAAVQATVGTGGGFELAFDPRPEQVTVEYVKQGFVLQQTLQFAGLDSRVTKPLFSTGSAPNDMLLGPNGLYVANSLDNTVTCYSLTGDTLATAGFPLSASPSFLARDAATLWVVANGANTVSALDSISLLSLPGQSYSLADPAVVFTGPSQPSVLDGRVYIPHSQIATFAPTTYAGGKVSCIDPETASQTELVTAGLNPQYSAVDASRGLVYIVCTGEIQFDEQYHPYATGDSIIAVYNANQGMQLSGSLNLGPVGAGRIVLSAEGSIAYLGNGLNGDVFKVDLQQMTVLRGQANPVRLTTEFTYISDLAFTPDGRWLLAASFNTDELYVIDPVTDEPNPGPYLAPFDLALASDLLAGCANIEISDRAGAPGKYDAYILYAVANAVARVELF